MNKKTQIGDYVFDFSLQKIYKNEIELILPDKIVGRKPWQFLEMLVDANGRTLTYEYLDDCAIWDDNGAGVSHIRSIKTWVSAFNTALGIELIKNKYATGYYINSKLTSSPRDYKKAYYEQLWNNHYKGIVRDQVATGAVRELIDFFVVPTLSKTDDSVQTQDEATNNTSLIETPFEDEKFSKFLVAGSGFGKSTLLDILLLCNIVSDLSGSNSKVLSANSRVKLSEYERIRISLFGKGQKKFFPVFIHSNLANSMQYTSAIELAEANDVDGFNSMLDVENHSGELLFLIDSIDEVESDKVNDYLLSIKKMLQKYSNASVVFASRFLGKKGFPFEYDTLYLKSLKKEDIEKITFSMLSKKDADRVIAQFNSNRYLKSLSKNPFMLMTILETKGDRLLHHLLKSIVNAIIDRRWEKHSYDISSEDIKSLLGFLACKFVFENREYADLSEIRQAFLKVEQNLKLYGVSYDVPSKNIEYFLKTLSSQSGILNIKNIDHVEKYLFQERLIMCWLAANYIATVINESSEICDREGLGGVWSNVYWLDKFLRSVSPKETHLSESAVDVFTMLLVMCSETSGQDIQKSILYYMFFRDTISLDDSERENILTGYINILGNAFGENDITNRITYESTILTNRMIDSHKTDA